MKSVNSDIFVLLCPTECDSIGISFEIHTNSRGNHALGLAPSCVISTTIRDESLKSYSSLVPSTSSPLVGIAIPACTSTDICVHPSVHPCAISMTIRDESLKSYSSLVLQYP